jgi:hypothetical protein
MLLAHNCRSAQGSRLGQARLAAPERGLAERTLVLSRVGT